MVQLLFTFLARRNKIDVCSIIMWRCFSHRKFVAGKEPHVCFFTQGVSWIGCPPLHRGGLICVVATEQIRILVSDFVIAEGRGSILTQPFH